jgi:hypothetical protein
MRSVTVNALIFTLLISILQIPFSYLVMIPLMMNYEKWNAFEIKFQTGATGNSINLIGILAQLIFFFVCAATYFWAAERVKNKA